MEQKDQQTGELESDRHQGVKQEHRSVRNQCEVLNKHIIEVHIKAETHIASSETQHCQHQEVLSQICSCYCQQAAMGYENYSQTYD